VLLIWNENDMKLNHDFAFGILGFWFDLWP